MHEYQNWVGTRLGVVGEETHHKGTKTPRKFFRKLRGFVSLW